MNDASEVLAVIFDCLHKAYVPNSSSDGDSESSTAGGSWDCQGQRTCMAHALFGLDIAEQMNCQSCGLESRHLKYTAFFHNINASALRTAKVCIYRTSHLARFVYSHLVHHPTITKLSSIINVVSSCALSVVSLVLDGFLTAFQVNYFMCYSTL